MPRRKKWWQSPTAEPAPTPTPPVSSSPLLAAAPWPLHNPTVIEVRNSSPYWLPTLDDGRDYVIRVVEELRHGFGIVGGRRWVLDRGGRIICPLPSAQPDHELRVGIKVRRPVEFFHIEGVEIVDASDDINLDCPATARGQILNCHLDNTVEGSAVFHNDCVQTWAGPRELVIDRVTGKTGFQGLFFNPLAKGAAPALFDVRRSNFDHKGGAGCVFGRVGSWPLTTSELYGTHADGCVVNTDIGTFPGVTNGAPPGGDFCPRGRVGAGYVTPGYLRSV